MRTLIIIPTMLIVLLVSCMKEKEFPIEPAIEFRSYTKVTVPPDTIAKTLILSISFTDGDGDIGLNPSDTLPPYDYNLFIDLYTMINGQFELVVFPDTIVNFNGRIPIVSGNPGNKPVEGVVDYAFDYLLLRKSLLNDTIAFDVSLKDRALHQSNIIRTPNLVVN